MSKFSYNNKSSALSRIPHIEPIRRMPKAVPKIESHIAIRSSFKNRHEYQSKFQTDEQVERQRSCEQVSVSDSDADHRSKNSFSKPCVKKNMTHQSKMLASTSTGKSIFSKDTSKSGKGQLGFFHCDSLSIRPTPASNNFDKQPTIERQPSISLAYNISSEPEAQQNERFPRRITTVEQLQESFLPEYRMGTDHENSYAFNSYNIKTHSNQPSNRNRKRGGIFSSKQTRKADENRLPSALQAPVGLDRAAANMRGSDQFHIVFEADQITQCCM